MLGDFPYPPGRLSAEGISNSVACVRDGARTITTFAHRTPGAALKMARGAVELPAILGAIHRMFEGDGNAMDDLFRSFTKIVGSPIEAASLSDEERAFLARFSGNPAWCRRAA